MDPHPGSHSLLLSSQEYFYFTRVLANKFSINLRVNRLMVDE